MKIKHILILSVLIMILVGCNQKKTDASDKTVPDSLDLDFSKSVPYYYGPSGDTIYVDFDVEYVTDTTKVVKLEKYYIVAGFTSFKNDAKFKSELARWKKLEPSTYVDAYGKDEAKKYFVSLGRFKSKAEVIPVFQAFQAKYPKENINYHIIRQ